MSAYPEMQAARRWIERRAPAGVAAMNVGDTLIPWLVGITILLGVLGLCQPDDSPNHPPDGDYEPVCGTYTPGC